MFTQHGWIEPRFNPAQAQKLTLIHIQLTRKITFLLKPGTGCILRRISLFLF